MKDKDFLAWMHARMEFIHKEPATMDYMHKLRAIINATPENQETPVQNTGNSLNYKDFTF